MNRILQTIGWAIVLLEFTLGCVPAPSGGGVVAAKVVTVPLVTCGAATTLYNTSPMALADIAGILPLGNFVKLQHVFPADRIYLAPTVVAGTPALVNVYAPADVTISQVARTTWTSPTAYTEYTVWFKPCIEQLSFFDHLGNLDPAFLTQIEDFQAGTCTVTGTYTYCLKTVKFGVTAGTLLGQAGGAFGAALEFGTSDSRTTALPYVSPARLNNPPVDLHDVCPLDYFDPLNKAALYAKLGSADGTVPRVAAPQCGKIMQDIAGTAMGRWYNTVFPDILEPAHITLGRNNVDGVTGVFSIGASIVLAPPNTYSFAPIPLGAGYANVDFSTITADGHIYCFDTLSTPAGPSNSIFFVQLQDATHLKIEALTGASCGAGPHFWDPWAIVLQR